MTGRTISVPTVFGYLSSNIEDDDASVSSSGVHIEAADVRGGGAKRTREMLGDTEGRAWGRWGGGEGRGRGVLVNAPLGDTKPALNLAAVCSFA
jgi:hypothetical protein